MNYCTNCGPDLVSNIVHGGMVLSTVGVITVLAWIRAREILIEKASGLTLALYATAGVLSLCVGADLFRWAIRAVAQL